MMKTLHGKGIVVIGGTNGIGRSAAQAFLREGATVVAVGRNREVVDAASDELDRVAPGNVQGLVGDAVQLETAERAITLSLQKFAAFDGLYHVAGGSGRRFGDGPLHEVTDEAITRTIELNLHSLIYSNRAAVRSFLDRRVSGSVLNMGSVLAFRPSNKYFATHIYAASKAAIVGFTQSVAAYYAPKNIRFNVVAPALVDTPMAARATADEEILRFIRTKQPLDGGRVGKPTDLDDLAVYFLSDLSRFVTGQVVAVDGGWSVSEGQIP